MTVCFSMIITIGELLVSSMLASLLHLISILSNYPGRRTFVTALFFHVCITRVTTGPQNAGNFRLLPCHLIKEIQSYVLIIQEISYN